MLAAAAAGGPLPEATVAELNRASRRAPTWLKLDGDGEVGEHARGSAVDRLLATYARSAMEIASEGRRGWRPRVERQDGPA